MDSAAHCDALLRQRDEDRWLAAQYAPPPLRRRLVALYTLHSELRLVPSRVSEPPLGEIRLQWHRDALAEIRDGKTPRSHPIVEELAAAGLADAQFAERIEAAISAAARPLYDDAFTGSDDLADWLRRADGGFDAVAVVMSGGDETLGDIVADASVAFSLAREGKGLAPDIDSRDAAQAMWTKAKPVLALAPNSCAPSLAHLYLTPAYLKKGERLFPLAKRLRLFSAIAFGR